MEGVSEKSRECFKGRKSHIVFPEEGSGLNNIGNVFDYLRMIKSQFKKYTFSTTNEWGRDLST